MKKEGIKMEKNAFKKSSMYLTVSSRLFGLATTVLILILTIKSELLSDYSITAQLVLSIPLLIGSMLSDAKIIDSESLKRYYFLNRISTAVAFGLLFNTLGLLISKYVSQMLGLYFFLILLIIFFIMIFLNFDKRKLFSEGLTILVIIFLGVLPSLKVY